MQRRITYSERCNRNSGGLGTRLIVGLLIPSLFVFGILFLDLLDDYPFKMLRIFYALFSLMAVIFIALFLGADLSQRNSVNDAVVDPTSPIVGTGLYPVCRASWGNLTIVDFGFFSHMAYQSPNASAASLDVWFNNFTTSDWQIAWGVNGNKYQQAYEFYDSKSGVSVVSIRGTTDVSDWAQNMDLWNEVAILQVQDMFLPSVSVWPSSVSQWLVSFFSVDLLLGSSIREAFYANVSARIAEIIPQRETVYLTGHSLGGGLASIMAATYGLQAVTFSAPGIELSRQKVGINSTELIKSLLANVIPDNDIVPRIDFPAGMAQKILCDSDPGTCHGLDRTVGVLLEACGDSRGRNITDQN